MVNNAPPPTEIFWWIFIVLSMKPLLDQRMLDVYRTKLMQELEKKRGSRIITLVHRQESVNFLGMPVMQYITIEDAQSVLNAIRLTDPEVPIDILLHTPGDISMPAEQVARALKRHKGKVTVFVPHYAMAGGTAIALAADELIMNEDAVLGAIEPIVSKYPASSFLKVIATKSVAKVNDETWIYADLAKKEITQNRDFVIELLDGKIEASQAEALAAALTGGRWTHDYPISVAELKQLGLNISTAMPVEIYQVMNLYPQPRGLRPSVEFIPLPYSNSPVEKKLPPTRK
jgi:ClpP class serine protease